MVANAHNGVVFPRMGKLFGNGYFAPIDPPCRFMLIVVEVVVTDHLGSGFVEQSEIHSCAVGVQGLDNRPIGIFDFRRGNERDDYWLF